MPIPSSGGVKIYPDATTIVSGTWSLVNNVAPQATVTAATLDAYFATRVDNNLISPNMARNTEKPAASGVYVPNAADYEISCSPDSTRMVFDYTGTPTEIDILSKNFPMGCTFNQIVVLARVKYTTGPARDRQMGNMVLNFFGSPVLTAAPSGSGTITEDIFSSTTAVLPFSAHWGIVQFLKTFGIKATMSAVVSGLLTNPAWTVSTLVVLAAYNTGVFNPTADTPLAIPGDIAQVSGSNFDIFSSYKIYWDVREGEDESPDFPGMAGGITIDRKYFYIYTPSLLRFFMPTGFGIPYGGARLMLVGVPGGATLYTGEVPIANFNILLVDGSGVYQLTTDKRNDTYYDRGTTPVETIDIKIPDPFARTGYF